MAFFADHSRIAEGSDDGGELLEGASLRHQDGIDGALGGSGWVGFERLDDPIADQFQGLGWVHWSGFLSWLVVKSDFLQKLAG